MRVLLAKGDYILTLDADDLFDVSFLEKAITVLNNSRKLAWLHAVFNMLVQAKKVLLKGE